MSTSGEAVANMETQINEAAERRAMEKVARVFARVLLTINGGKVDYDFWAKATWQALDELTAEAKPTTPEDSLQQLKRVGTQWLDLGAPARVAHPMARSGISPAQAKQMTDRELLGVRNMGRKTVAELRKVLAA